MTEKHESFVITRTGTHAAVVLASSKALALKGVAELERQLGRKLVRSSPTYQRIAAHWQLCVIVQPSDTI